MAELEKNRIKTNAQKEQMLLEIFYEENFRKKDKELFEKFIKTYEKLILIIMVNNQQIGFVHGEELNETTYEIQNICINPAWQGKGIGTQIIKDILKQHKNKNIEIRCFKQNPVRKLYERLGFKLTNETEFHYHLTKHKGEK